MILLQKTKSIYDIKENVFELFLTVRNFMAEKAIAVFTFLRHKICFPKDIETLFIKD